MKIAIVGATGYVGSAIVAEAVARGHAVTALSRNPEKAAGPGVTAVKADVWDANLAQTLKGQDVVISSYNPGWTNPKIRAEQLAGSQAVLSATRAAGVPRLLMIGGAGTSEIRPGVPYVTTDEFNPDFKEGALGAKEAAEWIEGVTDLDWVFFLPAINLVPGERTGKYRKGGRATVLDADGKSTISTADFAVALIDEAETPKHHRERIAVGY